MDFESFFEYMTLYFFFCWLKRNQYHCIKIGLLESLSNQMAWAISSGISLSHKTTWGTWQAWHASWCATVLPSRELYWMLQEIKCDISDLISKSKLPTSKLDSPICCSSWTNSWQSLSTKRVGIPWLRQCCRPHKMTRDSVVIGSSTLGSLMLAASNAIPSQSLSIKPTPALWIS